MPMEHRCSITTGSPKKTGLPDWDPEGKTGLAKVLGIKADGEVTTNALRFKAPAVIITDEEEKDRIQEHGYCHRD